MDNDDLIKQIRERLAVVDREAKEAWTAFDEARKAAITEHGHEGVLKKEIFEPLHEKNQAYGEKADESAQLRSKLDTVLGWGGGQEGDSGKTLGIAPTASLAFKTAAQRVVESDAYKALLESGVLAREKSRVDMAPVEALSRDEAKALLQGRNLKTLVTGASDTSGGAFVVNDRLAGFYELLTQRPLVLELITVGDTDSDTVEYVKQTGFTNAAAEVAEAVDLSTGTKPESAMTFAIVQEVVQTIAHWIPATKRALSDAGQLRTIIDSQMEDGIRRRLETQVISGNGSAPNLRGILNTAGIGTVAKGGAEAPEDAIHRAITTIRLAFLEPTAVVLHPNDWQGIRLQRDANGVLLFGPANIPGPQQLWGLPVSTTASIAENTGLVGKYDEAVLWNREGISIVASDSHADFFIKNLVAILAEGRWAFGVPRPAAFCAVTSI